MLWGTGAWLETHRRLRGLRSLHARQSCIEPLSAPHAAGCRCNASTLLPVDSGDILHNHLSRYRHFAMCAAGLSMVPRLGQRRIPSTRMPQPLNGIKAPSVRWIQYWPPWMRAQAIANRRSEVQPFCSGGRPVTQPVCCRPAARGAPADIEHLAILPCCMTQVQLVLR